MINASNTSISCWKTYWRKINERRATSLLSQHSVYYLVDHVGEHALHFIIIYHDTNKCQSPLKCRHVLLVRPIREKISKSVWNAPVYSAVRIYIYKKGCSSWHRQYFLFFRLTLAWTTSWQQQLEIAPRSGTFLDQSIDCRPGSKSHQTVEGFQSWWPLQVTCRGLRVREILPAAPLKEAIHVEVLWGSSNAESTVCCGGISVECDQTQTVDLFLPMLTRIGRRSHKNGQNILL